MAQVVTHLAEFQAAKTNVVTISFGTAYWAQLWLQETQSPFPLLLDPGREAYRAYHLQSSRWRAYSLPNLWYYAKAILRGRKLLGKRGDVDQLGGDFIIDSDGLIRFAHPSRQPTDRPEIAQLLAILRRCNDSYLF